MSISSLRNNQSFSSQREVISISIDENILSLRGLSPKRLRFEIEYALERGSTANSFLINAGYDSEGHYQPPILIHPPGAAYNDVFLEALALELPEQSTELLVVVGHINPNRIALLKNLAKIYSQMQLICSVPGAKLLQELWQQQKPAQSTKHTKQERFIPPIPEIHLIKKQQAISVGHGYQLQLIPAATARWPGGLLAFEDTLGLLMSDKFFAAHLCTKDWAEKNRVGTEEDRRYFFDSLMASMSSQVDSLIDKLEELEINTIAPGHGPAIESSWRSLLNDYRHWGESKNHSSIKVVLLFASAYGNTAAMADALANGVIRTGVCVESLNCEFTPANELVKAIQQADAYLIGSPTLGGHAPTPIVSALGTLLAEGDKDKPIGIFGSYGWSGEALDLLENKLRNGGFKFGFKPIKVKFSPTAAMLKTLEETGTFFARDILKEQKRQQSLITGGISNSRSDPAILALGRIIGSLCVLTTRKGEGNEQLSGAMVASWVSQASFNPPGISIAVAKDRAVGAMLHCDDYFTLNVLAQGRHNELMKQFLQPFSPGEDRLSGLQVNDSPQGQPILPEALAWLECCVKYRMECGDHWLIYAQIKNGKLLDSEGTTAIHHRRTGANY